MRWEPTETSPHARKQKQSLQQICQNGRGVCCYIVLYEEHWAGTVEGFCPGPLRLAGKNSLRDKSSVAQFRGGSFFPSNNGKITVLLVSLPRDKVLVPVILPCCSTRSRHDITTNPVHKSRAVLNKEETLALPERRIHESLAGRVA